MRKRKYAALLFHEMMGIQPIFSFVSLACIRLLYRIESKEQPR